MAAKQDHEIEIETYPLREAEPMLAEQTSTKSVNIHFDVWDSLPNWRPHSFRWYFFAPVLFLHLGQLVLTILILVAHYRKSTVLHFGLADMASYVMWQYAPLISVVCTSSVWEINYIHICQLEPFYQLAQPGGSTLRTSLSQDYLTSFTLFVPYRAYRNRHTAVGLSALLYILTSMALPVTAAALLKLQWSLPDFHVAVAVSSVAAGCCMIVLVSIIVCGFWLYILLKRRQTGVFSDPGSISGIATLISGSNLLDEFRKLRSYDCQTRIDQVLGDCRLRLGYRPEQSNPYQIRIMDPVNDLSVEPEPVFKNSRAEAHSWWLWGRTFVTFRLLIFAMTLALTIVALKHDRVMGVSVNKAVLTLVNVANAALFSNWHMNVAILEPYYRLTEGKTTIQGSSAVYDPYCRIDPVKHRVIYGSSSALHLDFTSSAVSNIFSTMRKGTRSKFVGFIAFTVIVFQFSIIMNAAYINISALLPYLLIYSIGNGGPGTVLKLDPTVSSYGMLVDWWFSVAFFGFQSLISLSQLIMMLYYKRTPILPRKPYTLSSTILYLCNSEGLLEDMEGLSCATKKARDWRLKRDNRKYGIGWIQKAGDEHCHIAIERLEQIEEGYVFDEPMSPGAR